jgi:hypothetical protein
VITAIFPLTVSDLGGTRITLIGSDLVSGDSPLPDTCQFLNSNAFWSLTLTYDATARTNEAVVYVAVERPTDAPATGWVLECGGATTYPSDIAHRTLTFFNRAYYMGMASWPGSTTPPEGPTNAATDVTIRTSNGAALPYSASAQCSFSVCPNSAPSCAVAAVAVGSIIVAATGAPGDADEIQTVTAYSCVVPMLSASVTANVDVSPLTVTFSLSNQDTEILVTQTFTAKAPAPEIQSVTAVSDGTALDILWDAPVSPRDESSGMTCAAIFGELTVAALGSASSCTWLTKSKLRVGLLTPTFGVTLAAVPNPDLGLRREGTEHFYTASATEMLSIPLPTLSLVGPAFAPACAETTDEITYEASWSSSVAYTRVTYEWSLGGAVVSDATGRRVSFPACNELNETGCVVQTELNNTVSVKATLDDGTNTTAQLVVTGGASFFGAIRSDSRGKIVTAGTNMTVSAAVTTSSCTNSTGSAPGLRLIRVGAATSASGYLRQGNLVMSFPTSDLAVGSYTIELRDASERVIDSTSVHVVASVMAYMRGGVRKTVGTSDLCVNFTEPYTAGHTPATDRTFTWTCDGCSYAANETIAAAQSGSVCSFTTNDNTTSPVTVTGGWKPATASTGSGFGSVELVPLGSGIPGGDVTVYPGRQEIGAGDPLKITAVVDLRQCTTSGCHVRASWGVTDRLGYGRIDSSVLSSASVGPTTYAVSGTAAANNAASVSNPWLYEGQATAVELLLPANTLPAGSTYLFRLTLDSPNSVQAAVYAEAAVSVANAPGLVFTSGAFVVTTTDDPLKHTLDASGASAGAEMFTFHVNFSWLVDTSTPSAVIPYITGPTPIISNVIFPPGTTAVGVEVVKGGVSQDIIWHQFPDSGHVTTTPITQTVAASALTRFTDAAEVAANTGIATDSANALGNAATTVTILRHLDNGDRSWVPGHVDTVLDNLNNIAVSLSRPGPSMSSTAVRSSALRQIVTLVNQVTGALRDDLTRTQDAVIGQILASVAPGLFRIGTAPQTDPALVLGAFTPLLDRSGYTTRGLLDDIPILQYYQDAASAAVPMLCEGTSDGTFSSQFHFGVVMTSKATSHVTEFRLNTANVTVDDALLGRALSAGECGALLASGQGTTCEKLCLQLVELKDDILTPSSSAGHTVGNTTPGTMRSATVMVQASIATPRAGAATSTPLTIAFTVNASVYLNALNCFSFDVDSSVWNFAGAASVTGQVAVCAFQHDSATLGVYAVFEQCPDGSMSMQCTTECQDFYYGSGCANLGNCTGRGILSKSTGACDCQSGFTGDYCQLACNEEAAIAYKGKHGFGANCDTTVACAWSPDGGTNQVNEHTGYCNCTTPRWSGSACDIDGDACLQAPCNGGTCLADTITGFTCDCPSGYGGNVCQTKLSECVHATRSRRGTSVTCENNGMCDDATAGCDCLPGFTGEHCESYCPDGYFGALCATQCECAATGVCNAIDGTCACTPGYSGSDCGTEDPDMSMWVWLGILLSVLICLIPLVIFCVRGVKGGSEKVDPMADSFVKHPMVEKLEAGLSALPSFKRSAVAPTHHNADGDFDPMAGSEANDNAGGIDRSKPYTVLLQDTDSGSDEFKKIGELQKPYHDSTLVDLRESLRADERFGLQARRFYFVKETTSGTYSPMGDERSVFVRKAYKSEIRLVIAGDTHESRKDFCAVEVGEVALFECSGCGLVGYSSQDAQRAHWSTHKAECKAEQARKKRAADVPAGVAAPSGLPPMKKASTRGTLEDNAPSIAGLHTEPLMASHRGGMPVFTGPAVRKAKTFNTGEDPGEGKQPPKVPSEILE